VVSCCHRKIKVEKGFLTAGGKAWFRRHAPARQIKTDGENESTGADWRRKQAKQRKTRYEDPGRARPETMSGDLNGSRAPDAKHGQEKRNQPARWRVKTHERQTNLRPKRTEKKNTRLKAVKTEARTRQGRIEAETKLEKEIVQHTRSTMEQTAQIQSVSQKKGSMF
jgi:hypothetical protein